LSVEPQLGAVNLWEISKESVRWALDYAEVNCLTKTGGIRWVIQGCESGAKRRPFDLKWAYSMKEQCQAAGVPYFLKQIQSPIQLPAKFAGEQNQIKFVEFTDKRD